MLINKDLVASPTTSRQMRNDDFSMTHQPIKKYGDNLKQIKNEHERKAALRAELEQQMAAKVFKRERERLMMDDKQLATSRGLLESIGAKLTQNRPAEESTDMNLLKADFDHVSNHVRHLN